MKSRIQTVYWLLRSGRQTTDGWMDRQMDRQIDIILLCIIDVDTNRVIDTQKI